MNPNTEGINPVGLEDLDGNQINPATEENQATIVALGSGISGTGTTGQRVLTDADTWYAVPSTVPTASYLLIVSKETATGTLRLSTDNGTTPSTTFGNKWENTNSFNVILGASEVLYISTDNAGDTINWTAKELV